MAELCEADVAHMKKKDVVQALKDRGVEIHERTKRNVGELKQQLIGILNAGASYEQSERHVVPKKLTPAEIFKEACVQLGKTALTPEDIMKNVRLILNGGARMLPQTKTSLNAVAKSLREVFDARKNEPAEMPSKMHRCVAECLKSEDTVMVDLQLLALQVDLDARLQRLANLEAGAKQQGQERAGCRPDPVLLALGDDGKDRFMWEYYKAYCVKRPSYGKPVAMAHKPGSYVAQLYDSIG